MKITSAKRITFVLAIASALLLALAAPALADPPAGAPAPAEPAPEEFRLPAIEVEQLDEFMIVPPDDFETQPTIPEPATPKIAASEFGVGWPAAVAVGVALLAVVIMAAVWKRDEAF